MTVADLFDTFVWPTQFLRVPISVMPRRCSSAVVTFSKRIVWKCKNLTKGIERPLSICWAENEDMYRAPFEEMHRPRIDCQWNGKYPERAKKKVLIL